MPPKYLDDAKTRVQSQLKKFGSIVTQAKQRNLNEADTRDIVKAMISDILGFDPFFEVTGEFSIKGQYADFAVKTGEHIKFFVEVKSIDTKLDEKHLFQVIGYAANHGVEWAVLTNSDQWIVYRLFAGDDKRTETILDFSLTGEKGQMTPGECFLMFSKEGFRQKLLHGHWTNLQALHPLRIASMLCSPEVNYVLRREVQKVSGIKFNEDAICDIVLNQVIRGDLADQIKGNLQKKG